MWEVPESSNEMIGRVQDAAQKLESGVGEGAHYRGWLDLPTNHDRGEYHRIKEVAKSVREDADIVIIIGIGGSYLGTRAIKDALTKPLSQTGMGEPEVIYAGHHLSTSYLQSLRAYCKNKSVYINVISKSGTTLEPALAFRILRKDLEEVYGEQEASRRIIATTDVKKGALKKLAQQKGYETFIVPNDIGGRYSVLTAVGLLPLAIAGVDIDALMDGAKDAQDVYGTQYEENACYQYVAARNNLYERGKKIEILMSYEPKLQYINEWWKQLFGESEGKDGKGLYPSSMIFTTDLHSLGQYIQEGERSMFETGIIFNDSADELIIPEDQDDYDGLNDLAGKSVQEVCVAAREGTRAAHSEGGVPQIFLEISQLDAYHIGHLIYFFEKSCAVSGYVLGINPFNQPGVEAYKKEMYELLGR